MRKIQVPLIVVFWITSLTTALGAMPWLSSLQEAQQIAQRDRRLILLHFYTDWCGPCQRLEQQMFPRPDVQQTILANYAAVKINAEKSPDLARHFQVDRYPTDIIADTQGRVISRMVTPSDPGRYMQILNDLAARSQQGVADGPYVAQAPGAPARTPYEPGWNSAAPDRRGDWQPPPPTTGTPFSEAAYPSPGPNDQLPQVTYGSDWGGPPPAPSAQGPYAMREPGYDRRYAAGPGGGAPTMGSAAWGDARQRPGVQTNPYVRDWEAPPGSVPGPNSSHPAPGGPWARGPQMVENQFATGPNHSAWQPPTGGYPASPPEGVQPVLNRPDGQPAGGGTAPAADSPLTLDGFCPVTLAEKENWEKGNPQWGAIHRGRTYLFASGECQQRFLADPDRYSPVLSGFDPIKYIDQGQVVTGKRRHGMWFRGQMYLFADEASLDRFRQFPDFYAQKSQEIMTRAGR